MGPESNSVQETLNKMLDVLLGRYEMYVVGIYFIVRNDIWTIVEKKP